MPKRCFEHHKVLEAIIKFLTKIPFKSCIIKTLNVSFGKFATWISSLFDSFLSLPHITALYSQRIIFGAP